MREQMLERDTGRMESGCDGILQTCSCREPGPNLCWPWSHFIAAVPVLKESRETQEITTNLCPPEEAVNFSVSLGFTLK